MRFWGIRRTWENIIPSLASCYTDAAAAIKGTEHARHHVCGERKQWHKDDVACAQPQPFPVSNKTPQTNFSFPLFSSPIHCAVRVPSSIMSILHPDSRQNAMGHSDKDAINGLSGWFMEIPAGTYLNIVLSGPEKSLQTINQP